MSGAGAEAPEVTWQFWVDRGGTFTDCIGISPEGAVLTAKILSSDDSPAEAIGTILARARGGEPGAPWPPLAAKLGSTIATNALLERRGVPTALVATAGLGDVARIGTQQRPELFELDIRKSEPLHARTIEVGARVAADGERLVSLDEEGLRHALETARADGLQAVAIALLHATRSPVDERAAEGIARELGFEQVSVSSQVVNELGLLARTETTVVDAYLTPLLRRHVEALERDLPGARLRFMQSSGGLTDARRFRGPHALLSGPAGGVVGARRVAREAGFAHAIGFDMGGTSTDVSLIPHTGAGDDGAPPELDRVFEGEVGGVRVRAPMLRMHTVAAGGGSLCRFDGFRQTVGPESAGSLPGPLCYGRRDAEGHALASELALTDINVFLGRVQPDRFPIALDREAPGPALERIAAELRQAGFARSLDDVAAGFVEIANAHMAQATRQVSVERGVDPRECALVGFGGAAGQHVCAIARELGMRTVLLHPLAGLLSAWGIGLAEDAWDGQRDARAEPLRPGEALPGAMVDGFEALEAEGRALLERDSAGVGSTGLEAEWLLDLRYRGTDTALSVRFAADDMARTTSDAWLERFESMHDERFGYRRAGRDVEAVTLRVRVWSAERPSPALGAAAADAEATPLRAERAWFPGVGRCDAPVFVREQLVPGQRLEGPALLLEDTGTVVLDPGFSAELRADGTLVLTDTGAAAAKDDEAAAVDDPVQLEVFANRFASIAEQMGAVLRNTAFSTNIKERLDYSCAVFDADGGLVANAPHIPVHLGAMGETVRVVRERFPALEAGDSVCTNDPYAGGSHLPDVTIVTPVFVGERGSAPDFFVASRGHHADIGGRTPGSMPPDSRHLDEEGVLLEPFVLVRGGRLDESGTLARLSSGAHPARRPADNLADLEAKLAANRTGADLLRAFAAERSRGSEAAGVAAIDATMRALQRASGAKVAREIAKLGDGVRRFEDALDDGTPLCVTLEIRGDRMTIDFAGTGPAQPGNLNAPRAVVQAAVIYVLRSLVEERIPLNGGCLLPVEVRIPEGSLLDPPPGSAVVGGNVETSQRVVDVLLGALGRVAASQGTMNNVTFGDEGFGYYETLGGGAGAGAGFAGASAVHTHMTNTRITDPEVLESRFPVRLERFAVRRDSGGPGEWSGGDGLVREYRFTRPVTLSLLTERRVRSPWGLEGGADASPGRNLHLRSDGREEPLPGRCSVELAAGEGVRIETPGGGGYGPVRAGSRSGA